MKLMHFMNHFLFCFLFYVKHGFDFTNQIFCSKQLENDITFKLKYLLFVYNSSFTSVSLHVANTT